MANCLAPFGVTRLIQLQSRIVITIPDRPKPPFAVSTLVGPQWTRLLEAPLSLLIYSIKLLPKYLHLQHVAVWRSRLLSARVGQGRVSIVPLSLVDFLGTTCPRRSEAHPHQQPVACGAPPRFY